MVNDHGRVSLLAFQVTAGVFFAMAMITTLSRLIVKLMLHRRLSLDDAFLICGCICLIAATVLTFNLLPTLYWDEAMDLDPAAVEVPSFVVGNAIWYEKTWDGASPLTWTALYSVKFSFLVFFRMLVERVRWMSLYVKIVIGVCVLGYLTSLCEVWIDCPYVDARVVTCGDRYWDIVAINIVITTIDMITDILIFAIPFRLLWQVRIDRWQKIKVGFCLCLGILNLLFAIMRFVGLHMRTVERTYDLDEGWEALWFYLEPCFAITVVSITAFRSLFVSESRKSREKDRLYLNSPSLGRFWGHQKTSGHSSESGGHGGLPTIPSATLTGMRTLIQGGTRDSIMMDNMRKADVSDRHDVHISVNSTTVGHLVKGRGSSAKSTQQVMSDHHTSAEDLV